MSFLKNFKLALHWQIFIGMAVGVIVGLFFNLCGTDSISCPTWFHPTDGAINLDTFSWMGTLFLRLLKLIVIPLIFCALVNGISHMKVNQLGKVGIISLLIFKGTMLIAACLGLFWVNIMQPGVGFDVSMLASGAHAAEDLHLGDVQDKGFVDFLIDIVPENVFASLSSKTQLIQVIFCALIFGIAISIMGDKARVVSNFFEELFAVMLKIIHWIMLLAPYGVFGMLVTNIGTAGFALFLGVFKYMLTVALGLASMLFIVTPALVWLLGGRVGPLEFFGGVKEAMLTSFGTASTAATIPVSLECVTKNLGVSPSLGKFVIPTAATMNMNGAALYEGVVTLFLAQAYAQIDPSIDLSIGNQIFILAMVLLSTLGTPGIPHGGLITTTIVLKAVGLPLDALGLILAVDRVLDMGRTMTNTTGDCASAVMINHLVGNKRFQDDDIELSESEKELLEESIHIAEEEAAHE